MDKIHEISILVDTLSTTCREGVETKDYERCFSIIDPMRRYMSQLNNLKNKGVKNETKNEGTVKDDHNDGDDQFIKLGISHIIDMAYHEEHPFKQIKQWWFEYFDELKTEFPQIINPVGSSRGLVLILKKYFETRKEGNKLLYIIPGREDKPIKGWPADLKPTMGQDEQTPK